MYISRKKHILTRTMMLIAVFNLLALAANSGVRLIFGRREALTPDMLDVLVFNAQLIVSGILIVVRTVVFILAKRKIKRMKRLVAEDDMEAMSILQREMIPDSLSTLSLDSIEKLIKVWAVILVGIQGAYEITAVAYKGFISDIFSGIAPTPEGYAVFTSVYNSTHGFKYIGMLIAVVIGIYVTGIFLKDRFLEASAAALLIVFLAAFLLLNTSTITVAAREVKVVWTSVIFHTLQTVGLFVLSIYLNIRYKGM